MADLDIYRQDGKPKGDIFFATEMDAKEMRTERLDHLNPPC
jgi:hypothetical protein